MAPWPFRFALTLVLALPLAVSAQDFQQGPMKAGHSSQLAGRVVALHGGCALVLADLPREGWEGLGGNGRFFVCGSPLAVGQQLQMTGVQVDTRWARVGPRWRVVPVYTID